MVSTTRVELIAIGDELLNGTRANSHLVFFGECLGRYGLRLNHCQEVCDDRKTITTSVEEALRRADILFVTGGLGPTTDDLTREAVADALHQDLVMDESLEQELMNYFRQRGRMPTSNNRQQCLRLSGAEALPNPNGTAPGQWLEAGGKLIILLPGPPHELQPMVQRSVLPRLEERGVLTAGSAYLQLRCSGVGESRVAHMLDPILSAYGSRLGVAYCANHGIVDVRLSAPDGSLTPADLRSIGEQCRDVLGDGFFAYGDQSLAEVVLQRLRALGKTLSVAESCTGGLLASEFTEVAGASKVFMGGLVCYRNEAKQNLLDIPDSLLEQHGAVSNECAVAMAASVAERFESDYALSITGYAGPDGGDEPAGTVYLGYHSPIGVWSRRVYLPGSRRAVRERAVHAALDFIRRKLIKYEVEDLLESLRC